MMRPNRHDTAGAPHWRRISERACRTCSVAEARTAYRIAVSIPRRRVVRSVGTPSACRWGVERKWRPLHMERAA